MPNFPLIHIFTNFFSMFFESVSKTDYLYHFHHHLPLSSVLFSKFQVSIHFMDRWMHPPLPKKGDLGIAKNYRGITLKSIATKIYNAQLRNLIEPKIGKILWNNQNGFWRNRSTTSQILTIRRILDNVRAKNLDATILFVDFSNTFSNTFDSIHKGKMEQILLDYGDAAIMMLYKNTKVKCGYPNGDSDYFNIEAGVLQGHTLGPYLFIICLDDVLRPSIDIMKNNVFKLAKERSRRYLASYNYVRGPTPMI